MKDRTKNGAALGLGAALAFGASTLLNQGIEHPTEAQVNCVVITDDHVHYSQELEIHETFSPSLKSLYRAFLDGKLSQEVFISRCLEEVARTKEP
jgi:hypothetical protein